MSFGVLLNRHNLSWSPWVKLDPPQVLEENFLRFLTPKLPYQQYKALKAFVCGSYLLTDNTTGTFSSCLVSLCFWSSLQIGLGLPKVCSLPKRKLWGLPVRDFVQAVCDSCHTTNNQSTEWVIYIFISLFVCLFIDLYRY